MRGDRQGNWCRTRFVEIFETVESTLVESKWGASISNRRLSSRVPRTLTAFVLFSKSWYITWLATPKSESADNFLSLGEECVEIDKGIGVELDSGCWGLEKQLWWIQGEYTASSNLSKMNSLLQHCTHILSYCYWTMNAMDYIVAPNQIRRQFPFQACFEPFWFDG